MNESKLLEVDKDEWFYQSLKKYSNLFMFELESAVDALEILNETSLCVSGVQAYSKKCEILQLCVPPKLLRAEDEEGLCKDRDFKILSGGYAEGRIKQIKSLKKFPNLVATLQDGYDGVVIHEVGDDDRATILEKSRLPTGDAVIKGTTKSLCCVNESLIVGMDNKDNKTESGVILHEWKTGNGEPSSGTNAGKAHHIWKNVTNIKCGNIVKLMEWDNNTCVFLTSTGTIALYDFRTGPEVPSVFFHSSKSPNNPDSPESPSLSGNSIIYSSDCIPHHNKIGILDSCGGYETFDPRFTKTGGNGSSGVVSISSATSRTLLPDFSDLSGIYPEWFNIEYEPWTKLRENVRSRFTISGLKKECVPVYQEIIGGTEKTSLESTDCNKEVVHPVFSHDGHSKPVSHSIWHPVADNLVFSAAVDAVLHAWQFIPEETNY